MPSMPIEPTCRRRLPSDFGFGDILRHARKRQRLTQATLANRCGCSAKAISLYETARRHPSPVMLRILCRNLGLQLLCLPVEECVLLSPELLTLLHSEDVKRLLSLLVEISVSDEAETRRGGTERRAEMGAT